MYETMPYIKQTTHFRCGYCDIIVKSVISLGFMRLVLVVGYSTFIYYLCVSDPNPTGIVT